MAEPPLANGWSDLDAGALDARPVEAGRRSWFVRVTIFRPVSLLVILLALVVLGLLSYPRIGLQLVPPGLSMGACGIWIPVRDSTPREVMEEITRPCEDQLRTIPGLRRVVSTSGARRSNLRLEFSSKADMDLMIAEVRDRMERARASWPEGVDEYRIWRHRDSDMPVFICALSMDADEERVDVDHIFDEVITKRLQAVDGVASVTTWGLLDKRVEIGLDADKVDAHGIPLRDLIARLAGDNVGINAGTIRDGDRELLVVADGRFRDFEEVAEYPANTRFRVKDFADVDYAYSVRDQMSRVNGHPSRVVVINKESSANTVEVCRRIESALAELEERLRRTVPTVSKVEVHAWLNQGEMIRFSIESLRESAAWGGLFAVLVLLLFFRKVGLTFLVTLSIPLSLLVTVTWIFFRGGTFNLLSLMGLSLGIGMLVDNSIVVVENVLRQREAGRSPVDAAIHGVQEVGLAVTLATLTTVMVFLPVLFVGDPRFEVVATEIGEPVCVSVLASLLAALVFIPLGTLWLERRRKPGAGAAGLAGPAGPAGPLPAAKGGERRPSWPNRLTARMAAAGLRHRLETLMLGGGLALLVVFAYRGIPKRDTQAEGPRRLEMHLRLPQNFTLREANDAFARVEKVVLDRKEELRVRSVTSWFSSDGGEINIFLEEGERVEEDAFFARLRPLLPRLPGVTYRLGFEDFAREDGGKRLRVFIRGNDLRRLAEIGASVRSELENRERFPELQEVDEWSEEEEEEIRVDVLRRVAQEYGIDTGTVSRMVAWALRGAPLPDFNLADRELPFWIAYAGGPKENIEEINAVRVFDRDGRAFRLENLIERPAVLPGMGEIHRVNGKMTIGFSASIDQGEAGEAGAQAVRARVEERLKRLALPEGFEISMRAELGGFDMDFKNAALAATMSFLLVFFVMGLLFESFILPLSVLCSIPFAFCGSIILLWALSVSLDMVGMIGMVMLLGIVVNNAIVLVDYVNRVRREGLDRDLALIQAVEVRFRPIWMTALTTVFGLLPLMVLPQRGEGVDYQPLAVVLVGGLTVSTFFTLVYVPVLYTLLDDLREWLLGFFGARPREEETPGHGAS